MNSKNYKIKIAKYLIFSLVAFLVTYNFNDYLCQQSDHFTKMVIVSMLLTICFAFIDMMLPTCYLK